MAKAPKVLISIGDAWVDPHEVIAVDDTFAADDPPWPNVRVILSTGQVVFGLRAPDRVAHAVRHPEQESHADEKTEVYPDVQIGARRRAARRNGPRRLRQGNGDG